MPTNFCRVIKLDEGNIFTEFTMPPAMAKNFVTDSESLINLLLNF